MDLQTGPACSLPAAGLKCCLISGGLPCGNRPQHHNFISYIPGFMLCTRGSVTTFWHHLADLFYVANSGGIAAKEK